MTPNQPNLLESGTLLLNKPLHWTSFDVVKKVRNILGVSKVGHAGTLDPLATGLLILCTGQQTKQISYYQDLPKVYTGQLVLGKTTPSVDLETDFDSESPYDQVNPQALTELTQHFTGLITQVPPAYSAVKSQGIRAYQKARKGQQASLPARQVTITSFRLTDIALPYISFEVACSKGTYIRSLVRDFGEQLGTGAYLAALCRTQIGPYHIEEAHTIADLAAWKAAKEPRKT